MASRNVAFLPSKKEIFFSCKWKFDLTYTFEQIMEAFVLEDIH